MIVVDTNVIIGLMQNQMDAVRVQRLDTQWAAPYIVVSELRNTLLKHVRHQIIDMTTAKEMNASALSLISGRIQVVDGDAVLDVAEECNLSAYDAEYVVCARALNVPLVTLDRAIRRGAPDVAIEPADFLRRS